MAWREKDKKDKEEKILEEELKLEQEKARKFEEFCQKIGDNINKIESLPSNQGKINPNQSQVGDMRTRKTAATYQKQPQKSTEQEEQIKKKQDEEKELKDKLALQQFKIYSSEETKLLLEEAQKMEDVYCQQKPHNYLNLFGANRGRCMKCKLSECPQYRGSYNIESFRSVELFSCLECGCPMNRHLTEKADISFENEISELLSNKYVESQHLNFKSLVGIFFSIQSQTSKRIGYTEDNYRKFNQEENNRSLDVNLEKFVQILNEGSFDILSYYECSIHDLRDKLIEKKIFSQKQPLAKEQFTELYSFIRQVIKAERKQKEDKSFKNGKQNITNNENDQYLDQYKIYKDKIKAKLSRIGLQNEIKIYLLLINSKFNNPYMQFRRFLVAAKDQVPPELHYYYSSKYKYKGIIDSQIFFPQFFQINISTFVLTQHMPQNMLLNESSKEYIQQISNTKGLNHGQKSNLLKELNKNMVSEYYEKLNYKFKDYLDFNSFQIIEEQFKPVEDDNIIKAFSFMNNKQQEIQTSTTDFLTYCKSYFGKLSLRITAKIGPPTFTQISQNPINFYRISDQVENLNILQQFCEGLGRSQRVCIVLRPIVVRSNIEELILNVYRLNHFIIIKRVFKLLNQQEAELLSKIEKIKEVNKNNYIRMMKDGLVSIILLSKPGAQSQAKLLSNGCDDGLKMQKTQFLDDLYISHETESKVKFKEKLPKEFYNIYQSYSNLNMFSGLKEFFNLERLIFVDDNFADDIQNMFVNEETNQIFFKTPSEVKLKNFSTRKRTKIMETINSETFNFFLYSSQTDSTTEQIVTMFMSDCSLIQNVLVIIKPEYQYREVEIKQLLERARYKIIKAQTLDIAESQARDILKSLSILEINDDKLKSLATKFKKQQYVLSLVKPAGKKEMLSYLKSFSLDTEQSIFEDLENKPLVFQDLQEIIIPLWNDRTHKEIQSLLNSSSSDFDGNDYEQMDEVDKQYCLNYILEITYAETMVSIDPKSKLDPPIEFQNPQYPTQYVHIKVTGITMGEFEVRILKHHSIDIYNITIEGEKTSFKLLSWYYSLVNQNYNQRAPLTYQSRIFPEDDKIQSKTHVFDVQQYCGNFFLETVAQQFTKCKQSKIQDKGRESMIAFLWGMKLAQFVKELEQIRDENLQGFGDIVYQDGIFQGELQDIQEKKDDKNANTLLKLDKEKYTNILNKLKNQKDLPNMIDQTLLQKIENKIETITNSEVYAYSRKPEMRRILPQFLQNENIRVRIDNIEIQSLLLHGEFQFFDELYESSAEQYRLLVNQINQKIELERSSERKEDGQNIYSGYEEIMGEEDRRWKNATDKLTNEEKEILQNKKIVNTLCLSYSQPEIKSKYSLAANIFYLLKVELGMDLHSNPKIALTGNQPDFETLVKGITEGFETHYKMDKQDLEYLQNTAQNQMLNQQMAEPVPDLINMELFFIIIQQINNNLKRIAQIDKEIDKQNAIRKKQNMQSQLMKSDKIQIGINKNVGDFKFNYQQLNAQKHGLSKQVQSLTKLLAESDKETGTSQFDVYFNYQRSKAKEFLQDKNVEKLQIQRNRYFIQSSKDDVYYYEHNLRSKAYQVDIFDHSDGKQDILLKNHQYKDANLPYLQDMDATQKQWFTRPPFKVNHMRGRKDQEIVRGFEGVLVPNKKQDDQKAESLIEREIIKFKRFQKMQEILSNNANISKEEAEHQVFYEEMIQENPYHFQDKSSEEIENAVKQRIKEQQDLQEQIQRNRKERKDMIEFDQKIKENQKKQTYN